MTKIYDLIIIGAGPAGLSAGLYAGRAMLKTLIIEKEKEGGQIVQTAEIENYPGSEIEESGTSLIQRLSAQTEKFGAETIRDTVVSVEFSDQWKTVICEKETYQSKAVIVATGADAMKIGCPGEAEFVGRGISYCATCDGAFFTGLEVFVVGGGDAAVEEAIFLTKFARKVTVIHRRDQLRAAKSIREKAFTNKKIHFLWDSVVKEVKGQGIMESITVENVKTGEETILKPEAADGMFGLFVFIGYRPQTELFVPFLDNEKGYLITDEDMHTNLSGIFAAGDIRKKSLRQVVTAVADGAIAAVEAGKYVEAQE